MRVDEIKINGYDQPLGYLIEKPVISWKVKDTCSSRVESVQITLYDEYHQILFQKKGLLNSCGEELDYVLSPMTIYCVDVFVCGNKDEALSRKYVFETAKDNHWLGEFIGHDEYDAIDIFKDFEIKKSVKKARLYILGLGVYEAYINKNFVNQEFLMPGFMQYDDYLPYQTYDVTSSLHVGQNELYVMLGNGWYKGRLGYEGGFRHIFGSALALIYELHVVYDDESREIISSNKDCLMTTSKICQTGIYDGELYDEHLKQVSLDVQYIDIDKSLLQPRLNLPITVIEKRQPIALIHTPHHETVLDFGQNMTGWVEVNTNHDIHLQFGEIMQDGCFYNDNYRTARYGYHYLSDGTLKHVRLHFTFYAFRYVLVESDTDINVDDFEACLIASKLDVIGSIQTGHQGINQLVSNAYYGGIDNFLDVPTDCPQRDERLGWTGDAQFFCDCANYMMDMSVFYHKYLYDMLHVQCHLDGGVASIIPVLRPHCHNYAYDYGNKTPKQIENLISMLSSKDSSPWADAATIIPWTTYMHDGRLDYLKQHYNNMKMWVDYVYGKAKEHGNPYLYDFGFHFADWLSLDNEQPGPMGKTNMHFVSSVFYYYSSLLTAKAANVLHKEEASHYFQLANAIKKAIQEAYIKDGVVQEDTQTAYVLALYFDLVENKEVHIKKTC